MTEPDLMVTPMDLAGKQIFVKRLTDGQLMLLGRDATLLQKSGLTGERFISISARIIDILESAFVAAEDWDYAMDLLAKGQTNIQDILEKIMGAYVAASQEQEEAPKKPVVRRGRRAQ